MAGLSVTGAMRTTSTVALETLLCLASLINLYIEEAAMRTSLRLLVGFLTGYYQFNKHLHTIGAVTDPVCRGCREGEEE